MEKANGRRLATKLIVIAMKVNISRIKRMGMAYSTGRVEIFIKVTIKKTREMVMERCSGLMDHHTKEHGSKEFSTVRVK